jgi:hypothetical protein
MREVPPVTSISVAGGTTKRGSMSKYLYWHAGEAPQFIDRLTEIQPPLQPRHIESIQHDLDSVGFSATAQLDGREFVVLDIGYMQRSAITVAPVADVPAAHERQRNIEANQERARCWPADGQDLD